MKYLFSTQFMWLFCAYYSWLRMVSVIQMRIISLGTFSKASAMVSLTAWALEMCLPGQMMSSSATSTDNVQVFSQPYYERWIWTNQH